MDKFVVIGNGEKGTVLNELFYEVRNGLINDASFVDPYIFKSTFSRKLYWFRYHPKWRRYLKFIPNSLFRKYSFLRQIHIEDDDNLYLLFVLGRDVERLYDKHLLEEIKEKYGNRIHTVLVLLDSIDVTKKHNGWENIVKCFPSYDMVVTFDIKDSQKYGVRHFIDPYTPRDVVIDSRKKSDLFFIGTDKGRMKILSEISCKGSKYGLKCDFMVFPDETTKGILDGITKLDSSISYEESLSHAANASCLVEVLAEGQSSSSLRYYEAVVYNKKLLTNNPTIKMMPFYDERFIKYFQKIEDIDFNWLKQDTMVDYGYNDEFSIKHLFSKLSEKN